MSDRRPTRRERETKAYRLVLSTGAFGVLSVVLLIAAIVGAGTGGWFFASLIATLISLWLLRRSVS